MNDTVLSEVRNGVRTLTLNRPERLNAISSGLIAGLKVAIDEGEADLATRVFILRGAGRAFCSGMDRREFSRVSESNASARAYIESLQDITRAMMRSSKLILGAVHGWAAGGGLEWAIGCDVTFMARGTQCFFPEMSLGIPVPTGAVTALLPRLVGWQRARGLFAFGERFDADAALAMGLIWKVTSEAELFEVTQSAAEQLSGLPSYSLREFKRVFSASSTFDLDGALAIETESTLRAFADRDIAGRISNFKS